MRQDVHGFVRACQSRLNTAPTGYVTAMNIFEELRSDHDTQRTLLEELCQTSGASEARAELFERVKVELKAHAKAEERHFYTELLKSDLTQDKARHSVHEHEQLDDLLERLEEYEFDAPLWLTTANDLQERLTHHLDEEEREVFQLAGKALSEDQKSKLAEAYADMMSAERDALS